MNIETVMLYLIIVPWHGFLIVKNFLFENYVSQIKWSVCSPDNSIIVYILLKKLVFKFSHSQHKNYRTSYEKDE